MKKGFTPQISDMDNFLKVNGCLGGLCSLGTLGESINKDLSIYTDQQTDSQQTLMHKMVKL